MEPRARVGKNRGQQNFSDSELRAFLYAFGDVDEPIDGTKKVLDEIVTDFITELCFETARSAQLAGRQKVKVDDVKFACRKNPSYLGKIDRMVVAKAHIDATKKLVDVNDDKILSNANAAAEEPLGANDDDADTQTVGGRSGAGGK
ncbi:putative transcription initiation factor TFIID subunit 13 [Amylocarpus encephaloides]|uniref:Transcription initiation factor TFIID subunit 13 n=1 Tax=Amylocarpus encephaloides TaxID=45428 RepID=A0A9P8CAI6_9HELO|nr:putative transcription initiation factor TFIID subunit 13 [Amylocarpus encephaloides]